MINRNKKTIWLWLVVGLIGLCLAGCSGNGEGATPEPVVSGASEGTDDGEMVFDNVELSFWNGFTGADGKGMERIVNQFNEAYDGKIKVKMEIMPWDTLYQKILTTQRTGKGPDVGAIGIDRVSRYALRDVLLPLDSYVEQLNLDGNDFIQAAWNEGVVSDSRYAIPLDVHPLGLYYNEDLLKEAGFEHPPTTLDEFVTMAQALTKDIDGDGKIDQWGYPVPGLVSMSQWMFYSMVHQYGGQVLSDSNEPLYDSEAALQAMQFYDDVVRKYGISPKDVGAGGDITLFRQGKSAFLIDGVWIVNELVAQDGLNFKTAAVPQFGPQKATWAGSHNFVLFNKKDQSQQKIEASLVFIDYVTKHSVEWARAGQIPARHSVLASDEFKAIEPLQGIASQVDYLQIIRNYENFTEVYMPVAEAIAEVVLGNQAPKEALNEALNKAKQYLKANAQ